MNATIIKAFGVCTTESTKLNNAKALISLAAQRGYLIPEELCNTDMASFIDSVAIDYNSTFYKSWEDITSRSREELYIDQILHYLSTYGTGFQGEAYICNDGDRSDVPAIDFSNYKVIRVATVEEVYQRCLDMLYSGIALSQETLDAVTDFILTHRTTVKDIILDVDAIKNREAMVKVCDALNLRPSSGVELVRYIIYKATGRLLLIKDKNTLAALKSQASNFYLGTLTEDEMETLAGVFYRFKPIFLALKGSKVNAPYVNRLRKMAIKFHKPTEEGFWQTVLGNEKDLNTIKKRAEDLNIFKIVSLVQTIDERKLISEGDAPKAYFIRNGKVWSKPNKEPIKNVEYLNKVRDILYRELLSRLSKKAGTVKFPKNLELVCPTSEKNFAGGLPFGSSYQLSGHNYFGIYWKETDGTRDFDLSFIDTKGNKIGWNADYNSGDVIFSGDMPRANPDASEVLYFKNGTKQEGTLWINRFCGEEGSKYRYYFGQEEVANLSIGYMVDPNSIVFKENATSKSREEFLGAIVANKIYIGKFGFGESRISGRLNSKERFELIKAHVNSCLSLRKVLSDAGFREWDKKSENEPDFDLSTLNKDSIIQLFNIDGE